MRVIKRGPKEKEFVSTYKFTCHSCKSVLKAKSYEFRRIGFKNNVDDTDPGYVFMCPVCNCQRVVRLRELKKVIPVSKVISEKLDKALKFVVAKFDSVSSRNGGGIQNEF